jgi:hypothetical protein
MQCGTDGVTHGIAHQIDMLLDRHANQIAVKDLVLVVINNHALGVVILRCEEAIHPAWLVEPVVQHDGRIADLSQIVVSVTIELLDHLFVQFDQVWFVQDLDRDNNVLHRR